MCNCIHELLYVFENSAQREHTIVHDAPLIVIDTSLPTLGGLVRNRYVLPGTQVLESSKIMSSYTILHSYRLCPISFYQCKDQCSGYWVQCGVPIYVRFGGKGIMVLEIPLASKLGTPRHFAPKPHAIGSHNLWLIISMVLLQKLYRRTMEPCTTTKTTTIIGRWLTSEQYQLGRWFGVLYLTTDIKMK